MARTSSHTTTELRRPVIDVKNLTKKVGNRLLVQQLNFSIYPGEIVGFLGENGAGKTTTIRMLVGLMRPTSGKVVIAGFNLRTHFTRAIRHVGGIIENPEMYSYLTGYQNLVHYARMAGMSKGQRQRRIREIVELIDLQKSIQRPVGTYSLGMRQRLGLAQALLHRPSLLILDEPTNGLDPAGIKEIRRHLTQLSHEEGLSVFISSHLLAEMEALCDRILVMKRGRLIGEQAIRSQSDSTDPVSVTFTIEPAYLSKARMRKILGSRDFTAAGPAISFHALRQEIPAINRRFVEAGFFVYEVKISAKSLEERFLEATAQEEEAEIFSRRNKS